MTSKKKNAFTLIVINFQLREDSQAPTAEVVGFEQRKTRILIYSSLTVYLDNTKIFRLPKRLLPSSQINHYRLINVSNERITPRNQTERETKEDSNLKGVQHALSARTSSETPRIIHFKSWARLCCGSLWCQHIKKTDADPRII